MAEVTKPILAVKVKDVESLPYPLLATPKIDGIRCLKLHGLALSRSFKGIPNKRIRTQIERHCPDGVDGELVVKGGGFNSTQSAVMSFDGAADFTYMVFDYVQSSLTEPYADRVEVLRSLTVPSFVSKVLPQLIKTPEELLGYEVGVLSHGFEGVMLRTPSSPYKCGRSTLREGYLIALKRFEDAEAIVLDFEPLYHNDNPAEQDNFGRTKRSTHQENKIAQDTLGALIVQDAKTQEVFNVGTGFTAADRLLIWKNRDKLQDKFITYKFQRYGMKNKPRAPVFKGFRDIRDMGD